MLDTIIIDVNSETSIVFGGINWSALIGSNLAGQSEKIAASMKATHYVAAGEHSASVGTTKLLSYKTEDKGRNFYSAAAVFAQAHQSGVLITTQEMSDGRVWVVAAHDGAVIRDTDVLVFKNEADDLIAEIKQRHSNAIEISGDFETLHYLNAKSQLLPIKNAFQKIPTAAKLLVAGLLVLVIADTCWTQYKKYKLRQNNALEISQYIDEDAEWNKAIDEWAASIKLDGQKGLLHIYTTLGNSVPPKIGGWNLLEVNCLNAVAGWSCNARYEAGINSSNLTFKNNLPNGWEARWDGLTNAIGTWTIPVERHHIDRQKIPTIGDFSLNYISSLQRILPALKKVDITSPTKAQIATPEVFVNRGHGDELITIPFPSDNTSGIELPSIQTFDIEGPLRTLAVLPLIEEVAIKQLRFIVGGHGSASTLRESILTAKLTGEFYVR
ncbi:hypothetical protein [Pseudomonas helleri]|uniref:hypothetical protein n=1 Tax=Pseudomonas helleri TaxID=1608996 RepID=UPI003FCEF87A